MRSLFALPLFILALAIPATAETRRGGNPELRYYADAITPTITACRARLYMPSSPRSRTGTRVRCRPKARRPMQLMPATAMYLVSDRFSITENLSGGIQYLADLMTEFRGEMRLAVAAYYCGSPRIARQGLYYRNPDVVSYVEAVRRRYQLELREQENRDIPTPRRGQ